MTHPNVLECSVEQSIFNFSCYSLKLGERYKRRVDGSLNLPTLSVPCSHATGRRCDEENRLRIIISAVALPRAGGEIYWWRAFEYYFMFCLPYRRAQTFESISTHDSSNTRFDVRKCPLGYLFSTVLLRMDHFPPETPPISSAAGKS